MIVRAICIGLLNALEKVLNISEFQLYSNDFATIKLTDDDGKKYTISIRGEDGND